MKEKKNVNHMFNSIKAFICIGVVLHHFPFPGTFGQIIAKADECVVPFFVMIAGYYAFGCDENKILVRLKNNVWIFIYGLAVAFIHYSIIGINNGKWFEWFKEVISIKSAVKMVVFCAVDFAVPLWYMLIIIEVYIFWYFVIKYNKDRLIIKLLPFLFLLQLISVTCFDTLSTEWFLKNLFITRGVPWFVAGYYIHSRESDIKLQINNILLITVMLLGFGVAIVPRLLGTYVNFTCVGLLFYSLAVFLIGVKNPDKRLGRLIEYIGEKLSLNIYIWHCAVEGLLKYIVDNCLGIVINQWIYPIVVALATILVAFLIRVVTIRVPVVINYIKDIRD